jgi:hypothetical protein
METVLTLNEAFCENHRQHCAQDGTRDSLEITQQCERVDEAAAELRNEYYRIGSVRQGETGALCVNEAGDANCNLWASQGACNSNAGTVLCLYVALLHTGTCQGDCLALLISTYVPWWQDERMLELCKPYQ